MLFIGLYRAAKDMFGQCEVVHTIAHLFLINVAVVAP